jgi:hypothetical protein
MEGARRVAAVLLAYAAGSWVVLAGAAWVAGVLALPSLFDTLLRWGLVVGAVVAALVAWRFPEIGEGEGPSADGEP